MSSGQGAANFYAVCEALDTYGDVVLYSVMALGASVSFGIMLYKQGWKNYTLFILLVLIFTYAVVLVIFFSYPSSGKESEMYNIIYNVAYLVEGLIHYVITQLYLRVSFETKAILDREVLFNNAGKLAEVEQFKTRMKWANFLCPLLVLGFSVCQYIALKNETKVVFYDVGFYGWLIMVTVFTITWGWTLHKLYRDTKLSEKLLPDKRIFVLHGSLLVLFLLVLAINIYAYPMAVNAKTTKG